MILWSFQKTILDVGANYGRGWGCLEKRGNSGKSVKNRRLDSIMKFQRYIHN